MAMIRYKFHWYFEFIHETQTLEKYILKFAISSLMLLLLWFVKLNWWLYWRVNCFIYHFYFKECNEFALLNCFCIRFSLFFFSMFAGFFRGRGYFFFGVEAKNTFKFEKTQIFCYGQYERYNIVRTIYGLLSLVFILENV